MAGAAGRDNQKRANRIRAAAAQWPRVALLALAGLLLAVDASAWWNTTWSHRRKLTFDNSVSGTSHANFPVLVVLNSSRIDYSKTKNDGSDLRFVDSDDLTLLDHEIEKWDETGNSYVWVRVPQVAAASNTDFIWMYYGNAAAAALPLANQRATWTATYMMVQHFDEAAGAHLDSTVNGNNSSVIDVQTQASPLGKIGAADVFDGLSTDNVDVPDSATLDMLANDSFTIEAWIKTSSNAQQMVVSKEDGASEYQLWVDAGVATFWLNDGVDNARISAVGPTVNDGAWHYIVGRWSDASNTAEIFVDGTSMGALIQPALDAMASATPLVIGQEGDASRGFDFTGTIDEVRVRNSSLSTDPWIRAQWLSMSDTGVGVVGSFVSYGPEAAQCCGLVVTETATTITVNGPNRFDMRFNTATGGGIDRFIDAEENTGVDLAGGDPGLQPALFSDEVHDGSNKTTAANTQGAELDLLEATPARVKVRQEAFYQRGVNTEIVPALKGYGDYSIYGIGRMAIGWERRAQQAIAAPQVQQFQWTVSTTASAPLNAWTGYSQTAVPDPTPFSGSGAGAPTATDDFVMAQSEVPGARTDFLAILYQDWASANQVYFGRRAIENWQEVSWIDDNPAVPIAVGSERWSFLTYFKPTNLASGVDAAVTSRSADYRGPDVLTINGGKGSRWGEPSENTGAAGDWWNEAEAAYVLDLDPALGLDFDIDGSAGTPRYKPFFKIRQWRSFVEAPTFTVEGAVPSKNADYRAAVKPFARAQFDQDLTWYSRLEAPSDVTSPDVGTGGAVVGADFPAIPPYRHGYNARFDTDGERISIPTAQNFSSNEGSIEFWYLPSYDYGSGVVTDDMGLFGYEIDPTNYFYAYHEPYAGGAGTDEGLFFEIGVGGTLYSTGLGAGPSFPVRWRANEWVHLRFVWRSDPGALLQIWVNGQFVSPVPTGSYPVAAAVPANFHIGDRQFGGFVNNAQGRIDEFRIYSSANTPTPLAHGGLATDAREHLSNAAQDYTFTFAQEDASHRGEYLYLGADAKFRGINVSLDTPGIGAGLDLEWQYWQETFPAPGGQWADLEAVPGFTDQTNNLTQAAGTIFWASDPTDWAPYSLSGGPDLYYVRARLKSGSYSGQFPRENVIKTDILLFQYCHDITAAAQTFAFAVPPTTEVTLLSFTAAAGDASVLLEWRTASELRNLGFHLYRALSADGPWTRLTPTLVPGLGSSAVGQGYSFRDSGLQNGTRYFYRLDDVDAASKTTSHGPISAVPSPAASPREEAGGGSRDKKQTVAASCPDWVLAAYVSSVGTDAATASLVCTRHGDPEATSLATLSRDARSATLELRTGGFYALHTPSGAVRAFVPGFDFPQDEKAAALPIRRVLTEAVVGRHVQLGGVRALDLVGFKGLVPSALGKAEMQVGKDGTVRATRRGAARAPRLLPKSELATLLPSLFQGETKSAVVEIAPLRFDAQRQQLVLAKRVRVRLLFTGREAGESGRGSQGRAPRPRKPEVSGEVLARLYITSRGLHSVSFEQLFAGQARSLLASQLRLERQGEPVAFHLEPLASAFGPGSRLFFYADKTANSTDYSAEVAYELVRCSNGLVMPTQAAAPGSTVIATPSVVSRPFEADRFYQPGLLDAADPWLWEALASGATRVKSLSLSGVAGSGTAALDVFLQGASESGLPVDHHVIVSVNGALVGEARFAGKTPYRMSLSLPASLLREGANDLSLTNVGDTGVSSLVFLDRVSLTHPQTASIASGLFEGTWAESGTASLAGASVDVAVLDIGAASGMPVAADRTPRWLTGYAVSGETVRFAAEAGRRYWVGSRAALLSPRVATPQPSTLRSAGNQADYILVTPRAFLAAAAPLLERRQDQGLQARAVAFEEIASEFGHGQASAEAIQSFLAYAFQSWTRPSPRYVLLLGDASYDPRNFIGTSQPAPLPALWTKTSYLWTASDPLLAAVNGDDALPDLAIGRLPAASVEQAQALVAKLLAWEDSGQGLDGAAALVADNPDGAGDFDADVDDIHASYFASRETRLLKLSELGPDLRPSILDAFNSGLSYLGYVGHGGAAVWASENVWNSFDAPSLQAQSQQPLLVTMNCLNGYFVAPAFDSLSESLLKAEGRGAIAAFSPSGLSLDGPAHQYHRALMAALTSGHHERLGDAILAAQKAYADSGLMAELVSVYHLLGDPATRIR